MLATVSIVIGALIAGDVLVVLTGLPVPGAVVGLLALTLLCARSSTVSANAPKLFDTIIGVAPMFFVPAAVGVVANMDVIAAAWVPILSAITLSTAVTLVVTAYAFKLLLRADTRSAGR